MCARFQQEKNLKMSLGYGHNSRNIVAPVTGIDQSNAGSIPVKYTGNLPFGTQVGPPKRMFVVLVL